MNNNDSPKVVRVGTRGSNLAMVQAELTIIKLWRKFPQTDFQLIKIKTSGDLDQSAPLANMGGIGIFVKELEKALADEKIDLAIHSAKDLPAKLPSGYILGAVAERASIEDALICSKDYTLETLPAGATVATGSVRRIALLKYYRPDLNTCQVRGNIETRLRKLSEGEFDAIILAQAGLQRLKLEPVIKEILPPNKFIPSPGQGAIAVELLNTSKALSMVEKINDVQAFSSLKAERTLLRTLNAGCSSAVCGWARWEKGRLKLTAGVLDRAGSKFIFAEDDCISSEKAENLGKRVGEKLIEQGAAKLIAEKD
ncbi:MAG TPA: hydroxymethylbilane synthase [Caldithrix sp.]|nr:hydroxymethylbilane synthase [Caldithrix sp.]